MSLIIIKNILRENNLTITKADKNKAIVIINKAMLQQKVQTFIKENKITTLLKDPTDQFHKQIHHATQKCQSIVERK